MESTTSRERIYDIFSEPGRGVEDKVDRALGVGTEYLGLELGFLTRIERNTQEIVRSTGTHPLIRPGETCPLERAYCRRTVEIDGTLAVQNAPASPAIADAAVETFDLGTYIGAKVVVDDENYGTVCFADADEREESFTDAEEMFVELLANLVGQAFERRAYERELERRNEQLEAEKQRFEGIAETSYDILFRVGLDTEFTYVSSAVERILGYTPDELVGVPFAEIMVGDAIETARAAYERILEGEAVENRELTFRDTHGEPVLIEVNATPVVEAGEIVGAQGVGRDITTRRERERELRLKNRAMDEARIGISLTDNGRPDNPLVYVNGGFERITGYDADEILGQNCRFLQGDATDSAALAEIRDRVASERPASVELINYRRDGTPFWNQLRISPIVDDTGDVTHFLGFQADVTDRKRTEQLVQLLNRVLRHNLRNDMTAVLGFSELLERRAEDDKSAVGERIERVAEGLLELSEKAHELEKYAGVERNPERVDTESLLVDVAERYREQFPGAVVELRIRTERDICAGGELERAVSELVENALTHNPSPERWVGVDVVDHDDFVELTVEDDGPGIDEMEAAVIADGEETALEHGSGLGLWLVNWIVTRYGGSFQIEATASGTNARIRLPALDADTDVATAARRPTALFQ